MKPSALPLLSLNLPSKETLLHFYEQLLLIRRFEEKAGQLYGMGLIRGFCHLYIGQEAVVVGMQAAMDPADSVITAYRDHGHMLACGMEANGVMAELTGRKDGYSKGKGGSMHMFSREKKFFGGHGIVGAQISLGTGLAFAHKYLKDGGVNLAYMGDGAANQGQVYESFNMAALWKLPIVYIIENNQYAMGTSVARASATPELYRRGEPYGIPGLVVDGMDVMAVRQAGATALDHARQGNGPVLLEIQTYRYRGHSMSDPGRYRTKEEVADMREHKDPLKIFTDFLGAQKIALEDDFKKIEKKIKDIVAESARFAQESPEPETSELYTDVLISV